MNNKEAIKYGIEWLEDEYLDAGDRAFIELALEALKQMPVTTTAGEGGVIYYPQVEGVTPTVIDVGKQEPCEMTAEEYRQRMIQAFHNADTDELIAVCVLPTEKEFEHLEWLLKNHYKKEPCGDAIDRAEAIKIASGYCHPANVAKELAKLPPVNPTKTGWIPVSERLPEEYGEYLITWTTSQSKRPFIGISEGEVTSEYDYEHNRFKFEWLLEDYVKNYPDVKVIAWMPLPAPYEPQELVMRKPCRK